MIRQVCSQLKWLVRLIIPVVAILLAGSCTSANQPPVISSLTTEEEQVSPSGGYQVRCIASDPDGDELSYAWSASGGKISGEGVVAAWIAPEEGGAYTITVKVKDGRGGEATARLTIDVGVNHPPVIDSLVTEAVEVMTATSCIIECVASDPDGDELSYTWSASGGNISGEGAVVTWIAPTRYGIYTITVTVTDARGDEATENISIEVSCGCE